MSWLPDLLAAVPATLGLWAMSLAVGMALAVPVVAARLSKMVVLRSAAIVWIEVLRGIPTIVWLLLIFFGFGFFDYSATAMVTSVVALGAASSAYFAEVYRSGFESVGSGQGEGLRALGIPRWAGVRLVLLPQALPIIVAGCGSFSILLLKETALASLIGLVEIMNVARFTVAQGNNGMVVFIVVGLIYTILCLPLGQGSSWVSRRVAARTGTAG